MKRDKEGGRGRRIIVSKSVYEEKMTRTLRGNITCV
jgi:hypothetical protein